MEKVIDRIEKLLDARLVPKRKQKRQLSQVCGISYEAVRQWFSSTVTISTDYLIPIAKEWDANLQWLITGEGDMDFSPNITNAIDKIAARIDNTKQTEEMINRNAGFVEAYRNRVINEELTAKEMLEQIRNQVKDFDPKTLYKLAAQLEMLADQKTQDSE